MSLIETDKPPPRQPLGSANMSDIEEAIWKFWARRGQNRRLSSAYAFNGNGHVVHKERKCTNKPSRPTHQKVTQHGKS